MLLIKYTQISRLELIKSKKIPGALKRRRTVEITKVADTK